MHRTHTCTSWKAVSCTRSYTLSAHFEAFACGFSTSISSSCFSYNLFNFSLPMDSINCAPDNTHYNRTYMYPVYVRTHTDTHTHTATRGWLTGTSCKRHPHNSLTSTVGRSHRSRRRERTLEMCTPMLRWTPEQLMHTAEPRLMLAHSTSDGRARDEVHEGTCLLKALVSYPKPVHQPPFYSLVKKWH